jgi:hypothetical protein
MGIEQGVVIESGGHVWQCARLGPRHDVAQPAQAATAVAGLSRGIAAVNQRLAGAAGSDTMAARVLGGALPRFGGPNLLNPQIDVAAGDDVVLVAKPLARL